MLTREAIAALLPHDGAMVLLDEATAWDEARIACSARSHRDRSNPLRREGKLSSLCGVEYAAQAMALHGKLRVANDYPSVWIVEATRGERPIEPTPAMLELMRTEFLRQVRGRH